MAHTIQVTVRFEIRERQNGWVAKRDASVGGNESDVQDYVQSGIGFAMVLTEHICSHHTNHRREQSVCVCVCVFW